MATNIINTQLFSTYLLLLGISGLMILLVATNLVMRYYGTSSLQSYNWHLRNWRLKQLTAIACLFCLAMGASYWVIQDAWGWIYLLVAFNTGRWWFSYIIKRV